MTAPDDLVARLRARLDPVEAACPPPARGDGDLNGAPAPTGRALRPAAVLAPLILHDGPPRLLFTVRAPHLAAHAGQISFPGGSLIDGRESAAAAALRETREEIGVDPAFVDLVGRIEPYETVTGFGVTPFIGVLKPGYVIRPDPGEVADVFEAPFDYLMDPANLKRHERDFFGVRRSYFAVPWEDRYIWGATAGMLKALSERLTDKD